jgi:membrane fusion protein, multidrug efflux system
MINQRTLPESTFPPLDKKAEHKTIRWLWSLGLVLLAAATYYYWPDMRNALSTRTSVQGPATETKGAAVTPVVAAKARKGDIGVYITGLGAVIPINTVTVKSRVDGQLMQVLYKEGDIVREGDLLVEIDSRPYEVQLMQAEAQLAKDKAALENAQVDLTRYQDLVPHKAVPEQQLATQEALVRQDEAAIKADDAQIASAKLNLTYCRITAPISGRIGLRLIDPGNIIHAGDSTGLMVITQIQPISVIFTIAEDQIPIVMKKTNAGQRLGVDAFNRDMKTLLAQGWLTTLDNQIDQTTGTLKLRATFENRDNALFPDQFVNARLLVEKKRNVTIVPTAVIQRNPQMTYVYVVKPDATATLKQVEIGVTEGNDSEIVSGVAPGDVCVMTGSDKLREGSKVSVSLYNEKKPGG